MILAGVDLLNDAAYTGAIATNHYENILSDKPHFLVFSHYFYMRKPLSVRAYFVLAFNDKHAAISQDTVCLFSTVAV